MLKKINNVYLSLFGYFMLYIFYYCVIASIADMYGVSVAITTAVALLLTINSIRKREKKRGISFVNALGLNKAKMDLETIKTLLLLGIGLNFATSGVLNILPSGISQSYTQSYTSVLKGEVFSTIAMMVFVTPLLEEIFFRGIFQRRLMESLGEIKGLIISTCIFGFMHFNPIWSIYSAIIGFFLGCIYIKYNSIFPCAIVHSFFNFLSCIPMFLLNYKYIYNILYGNKISVIIMLIAGIGILWYIADKTWIKTFFCKEFYNKGMNKDKGEEENEEY